MKQQRYGIEVLHWAGMKDEFLPHLEDIISTHPEFINFENKFGENALHIATRVNNIEIVKWLIEKSNINYQKVVDKGNALLIAIENNCFKIANYFIDNTDIDYTVRSQDGKNIFHFLVKRCNDELLEKMLSKYPEGINLLDNNKQHCIFDYIFYFGQHKKYYVFDMLIEHMSPKIFKQIDINGKNILDFTNYIIEDSQSSFEKLSKQELLSPLLSQLEFYLKN
jgi:ankyrin repeat protein